MPLDGFQKIEDAQYAGRGEAYEGPPFSSPFLLRTSRAQLLALADQMGEDDTGWICLDKIGERGMKGRKHLLVVHGGTR